MKKVIIWLIILAIYGGLIFGLIKVFPYACYSLKSTDCYNISYVTTYDCTNMEYCRKYTYYTVKLNTVYIGTHTETASKEEKLGKSFVEKQLLENHKFYKEEGNEGFGILCFLLFIIITALTVIIPVFMSGIWGDCGDYCRYGSKACIDCSGGSFCRIYHTPYQYDWIKKLWNIIKRFFGYEKNYSTT